MSSVIMCKPQYRFENLNQEDQKKVLYLTAAFKEILSDKLIDDFIADRKSKCELGNYEAAIMKERIQPFLAFARKEADEFIHTSIMEFIDDYNVDDPESQKFIDMAISAFKSDMNKGNKT